MNLAILEFKMFLIVFSIFALTMISFMLICLWKIFKNDDNKGNNKNISNGYNNMGVNNSIALRKCSSNNRHNSLLSKNDPETIAEDLVMCHMLGIF